MIYNLFSTPIFEQSINDNKFIRLINDKLIWCESNNLFKNKWMPGNDTTPTTYKHDNTIIKDDHYLKSFIIMRCGDYLAQLGVKYKNVELVDSWFNKQCKGQNVGHHRHRNPKVPRIVSGVFYVKAINDSKQGELTFISHNPYDEEFPCNINNTTYNSEISVKAIQNNMLFFPSNITHKVTTNYTDKDRVVLSFNLEYDE